MVEWLGRESSRSLSDKSLSWSVNSEDAVRCRGVIKDLKYGELVEIVEDTPTIPYQKAYNYELSEPTLWPYSKNCCLVGAVVSAAFIGLFTTVLLVLLVRFILVPDSDEWQWTTDTTTALPDKVLVNDTEKTGGIREWVVTFEGDAAVRKRDNVKSKVLRNHSFPDVVFGQQVGGWVKLYHEPGYIKLSMQIPPNDEYVTLLRPRNVSYAMLSNITCGTAGMYPIRKLIVCEVAAHRIGLNIAMAQKVHIPAVPDGCYHTVSGPRLGMLWLSTGLHNHEHILQINADMVRPLCTSQESLAVTTITTTTTSTTTTTTITTTTRTWLYPSLFCWMLLRVNTVEMDLVREQFNKRVGVFLCDEYTLLSDYKNSMPSTTPIGNIDSKMAWWGSAANTAPFLKAWDTIIEAGIFLSHDFVVKVDADSVFFPVRLRWHLSSTPKDETSYFTNAHGTLPLLGPIEVFSRNTIKLYGAKSSRCTEGGRAVGSGEDGFINMCMGDLGIARHEDIELLQSGGAPEDCKGNWIVAYHPFKEPWSWFSCYHSASR